MKMITDYPIELSWIQENVSFVSGLANDYETSLHENPNAFLLNLHKEIDDLLNTPELSWGQIFSLWSDQQKVRDAIQDAYIAQYV